MPNLKMKRIGVSRVGVRPGHDATNAGFGSVGAELCSKKARLLATSRKDGDWGEDGNCGHPCTSRQRVNDAPAVAAFVEAGVA